jgi:hypothetical protein
MTQATPPPLTGTLEAAVLHGYTSQAAAADPSAGGMLLGELRRAAPCLHQRAPDNSRSTQAAAVR